MERKKKCLVVLIYIVLICNTFNGYAQVSKKKALRKLNIESVNLISTEEKIILYPRTLVYDLNNPDSVMYLNCISSDKDNFINYFDSSKGSQGLILKVGTVINRKVDGYVDSLTIVDFNRLISSFKLKEDSLLNQFNTYDYVVVFFWNNLGLDKAQLKNLKYFDKYIKKHPKRKIKLIKVYSKI